MAFVNSAIGYSLGTLTNPSAITYDNSIIGYAVGTLVGPTAPVQRIDSPIAFKTGTLDPIHKPIVMRTASGYRRTVVRMFDGSQWR